MKKERFEWMHSWCDETWNGDLPRVLLVGDSICYGYQEKVREYLRGVCYVDYVATSYAIDGNTYNNLILNFMKDTHYAVLHINHGLHGKHMPKRTYKTRMNKLLSRADKDTKIILATTTYVYCAGNETPDESWMKRVYERNEAVFELAKENGYGIDDLYATSIKIPLLQRSGDGTHYEDGGYDILAKSVVESIKKILKK